MKKIKILLFSLLLCFSASAQSSLRPIQFSLIGGLNFAFPVGDDMDDLKDAFDDYEDNDYNGQDYDAAVLPRIGVNFGFGLDYFLSDQLSINSGLRFSQKGFKTCIEVERDAYQIYQGYPNYGYTTVPGYEASQKLSVNLNYIDLPIGLKFNNNDNFDLFGGLMYSFLVSEKLSWNIDDSQDSDAEDEYDDEYEEYEDFFGEDPETTTIGFYIGFGINLNEQMALQLNIQKTSNFGDTPFGDDNQNLTLQLTTAYKF